MGTRSRNGFALVVVLLTGAVLLLSVVTATALSALGARRGTASELAVHVALLGAESAIDTFPVRAAADPPAAAALRSDAAATEAALNAWLEGAGLDRAALGNGVVATRRIAMTGPGTATLVATARLGRAEAQVARDFAVGATRGDLNLKAPAPLVSKPSITMNGNAFLRGVDATLTAWTYAAGATREARTFAAGDAFALAVTEATLDQVLPGEYVEAPVSGAAAPARFRVAAVDRAAGTIQVVALRPSAQASLANGAPLTHVPYAPRQGFTGDPATFPVTRAGSYAVGDRVTVANEAGLDVRGRVAAVDEEAGTIAVDWDSDPGAVAEGAPLRRFVPGAVSDGYIDEGRTGKDSIWPNGVEFAGLPSRSGANELFRSILGATPAEVEAMAAAAGTSYASWDQLPDPERLSGVTYVRSGTDRNVQFCGSGVLVVAGDLRTNNARCAFEGVIYVMGEWFEKGNREITGAVITEGEAEVCLDDDLGATCDATTDLRGTGDKITFDPDVVHRAGRGAVPSDVTFAAVPGTWRRVHAR